MIDSKEPKHSWSRLLHAGTEAAARISVNIEELSRQAVIDSERVASSARMLYAACADGYKESAHTLSCSPRAMRVASEALRLAVRYQFVSGRKPHLSHERHAAEMEEVHRWGAERVYQACIELGGGMIKLAQIAASRADLVPQAYVEKLSTLEDSAPRPEGIRVADVIAEELGASTSDVFAFFEEEAFAAASLAQVHRARLHDGSEVVVKVQIPGVADTLRADRKILEVAARMAGRDQGPALLPLIAELNRSLAQELDYELEAQVAEEFRLAFNKDGRICIPRVHAEFSTARVLTMEYIEGVPLRATLEGWSSAGELHKLDTLFATLIDNFCEQILVQGLFHGDPHPGNFLVVAPESQTPQLAILDFGSWARLSWSERKAYAEILGAVVSRNPQVLAEKLRAVGFRTVEQEGGGSSALLELAEMLFEGLGEGMRLDQLPDPKEQFQRAQEIIRKHPLVVAPPSFALLSRVFAVLGGLVLTHRPKIAAFPILLPHLQAAASATS